MCPRIDRDERHTGELRLVLHERPKLKERPTANPGSLLLAKLCPVANPLQVFHSDPASGVFSLGNELLADLMIDVPAKPRLPLFRSRYRLMAMATLAPFGSPGRLAQPPAMFRVLDSLLDSISGECILPSESTATLITPRSTPMNSLDSIGVPSGTSTVTSRNHLPSLRRTRSHCPLDQPNRSAWYFPIRNGTITLPSDRDAIRSLEADVLSHRERDGRVLAEPGPLGLVPLVRLDDLGDTPDRRVGGQTEPIAKLDIAELLKVELVGELSLEGDTRQPVSRFIEPLHRRLELGGLIGVGQELNLERDLHAPIVLALSTNVK